MREGAIEKDGTYFARELPQQQKLVDSVVLCALDALERLENRTTHTL